MADATASSSKSVYNAYAPLSRSLASASSAATDKPDDVLDSLGVSVAAQSAKVKGKQVALENPARESDARRKGKAARLSERKKKERAAIRGPKTRGLLPKEGKKRAPDVTWASHIQGTLGYISKPYIFRTPSTQTTMDMREHPVSLSVAGYHAKLVKADLLGCALSVRRGANPCLVGLAGIVVQETEGTFTVVTKSKGVKVLPKHDTVFNIVIPYKDPGGEDYQDMSFDISGNQFAHRAAERAGRKIKGRSKGDFAPWDGLQELFPSS